MRLGALRAMSGIVSQCSRLQERYLGFTLEVLDIIVAMLVTILLSIGFQREPQVMSENAKKLIVLSKLEFWDT